MATSVKPEIFGISTLESGFQSFSQCPFGCLDDRQTPAAVPGKDKQILPAAAQARLAWGGVCGEISVARLTGASALCGNHLCKCCFPLITLDLLQDQQCGSVSDGQRAKGEFNDGLSAKVTQQQPQPHGKLK